MISAQLNKAAVPPAARVTREKKGKKSGHFLLDFSRGNSSILQITEYYFFKGRVGVKKGQDQKTDKAVSEQLGHYVSHDL